MYLLSNLSLFIIFTSFISLQENSHSLVLTVLLSSWPVDHYTWTDEIVVQRLTDFIWIGNDTIRISYGTYPPFIRQEYPHACGFYQSYT